MMSLLTMIQAVEKGLFTSQLTSQDGLEPYGSLQIFLSAKQPAHYLTANDWLP